MDKQAAAYDRWIARRDAFWMLQEMDHGPCEPGDGCEECDERRRQQAIDAGKKFCSTMKSSDQERDPI